MKNFIYYSPYFFKNKERLNGLLLLKFSFLNKNKKIIWTSLSKGFKSLGSHAQVLQVIFWLLFILLLPLFSNYIKAQNYQTNLSNQLSNDYGLMGGDWLYGTDEIAALNALSPLSNSYCSLNKGNPQAHHLDLPFDNESILTNNCNTDASPWDAQINLVANNVISGDLLLFVFWTKGIDDQKNTFGAVEVRGNGTFLRFLPFSNTWQQWIIPVQANNNSIALQI